MEYRSKSILSYSHQSINTPVFVFHIDGDLLGLFAIYTVSTFPRALVHLFQHYEILNGFFLRSGLAQTTVRPPVPPQI